RGGPLQRAWTHSVHALALPSVDGAPVAKRHVRQRAANREEALWMTCNYPTLPDGSEPSPGLCGVCQPGSTAPCRRSSLVPRVVLLHACRTTSAAHPSSVICATR